MDNMNRNMLNLIASFKKTGQSDDVIKQSLWQMGMIPDVIDSHLEYYNKHTADCNRPYNVGPIVKENKNNMELTLENLYKSTSKAIEALKEMRNDDKLGFSAATAQSIIENNLSKLNISNDNEVILQECIKAGKEIEDTLVNPVLKYAVAEGLFYNLTQYDWIMPVSDLRKSIFETFEGDKWGYVAAKFAKEISKETGNKAFETLYESLIDTLIDEDNKRLALKNVLLENTWNSKAKGILSSIVAEEKAEQGEIDSKIYENNNCSIRKNISPCLVDGDNRVFFLNGKNYIYDGKKIVEAKVTDRRYLNVLEGLSLMKYEEEKDRLVYYGKNDMLLEYNCSTDKFSLTGMENFSDMSLIDMNETLKRCGIFDRETIQNCEKLIKFYESRDLLTDLDIITTINRNDVAGVMVSIINVEEGIVVNKVNLPFNYNEMVVCESAIEACKVIKDFIKYDATNILVEQLKKEGEEKAIIESKRNEIKDTITFLTEKRAEIIKSLQETDNNELLKEALKLVESEIRKFEKKLQESYSEKKKLSESFLNEPSKPNQLNFNKKKMLKNGYMEVIVEKPVKGLNKGDVVFALTNEFGQIGDDGSIKVLKDEKDEDGIIIPIKNLKIK